MPGGRSNKLVGQAGEYLVAAELSRRGLIATTFTGNVPHYDIIASDEEGRHVSVQVKTATRGSWQFGDIRRFCEMDFEGRQQAVGELKSAPVRGLVIVFVRLDPSGEDAFYVLTWPQLTSLLAEKYRAFLARNEGVRPKRWDSLHVALKEDLLEPFRDRWETVQRALR